MNKSIIAKFDEKRDALLAVFGAKHPECYLDIVKELVKTISSDELPLDPERITMIDHGHYQGSQLFIIAESGYQPSDYWATECSYGSCSGCDTLEHIRYSADNAATPDEKQARDYLTLALHLAQRMEKLFQRAEETIKDI